MGASINSPKKNKKVIFVQGPTGAGKSHWALQQARRIPGSCIVNCDSVQIYKYVDIGSSKPTTEDLKIVPHYLYSEIDFPDTITAGQYERLFFSKLENMDEAIVFVVGGTGFYFRALEKGMYPVTEIKNAVTEETRLLVNEKGFGYLYDWILDNDPEHARKLSRNDHYRIERAYQLMRSEGKTITEIQRKFEANQRKFPYPLLKIGITEEKQVLKDLVTQRTKKMLDSGLIKEVETLLHMGFGGWDPLNSVGYKEVSAYLKSPSTPSILCEEIIQNTMKLIKKQKTWFQSDKEILWLNSRDLSVSVVDSFVSN